MGRGAGRKIVQNAIFHGKRHDNKILKVKFFLSRNFVVMAQAPSLGAPLVPNYPRNPRNINIFARVPDREDQRSG